MTKGKIIFLNGVTSAGKTSIAKAIQEVAEDNFYHVSNDFFLGLEANIVNFRFIQAHEQLKYMAESIILMYHTVKVLAEQGTNVVVDGMLFETDGFIEKYGKTNYENLQQILGANMFMVEVFCPLEECRRRNKTREDREENQSHEQHDIMNKAICYDMMVDTSVNSAEECAAKILEVMK